MGATECKGTGVDRRAGAGDIYSALLAAGKMEDPFFGDNEYKAKVLMEEDYEYRTHFRQHRIRSQIVTRYCSDSKELIRWQIFI